MEPEDELLSILEEIITEEENKTEGNAKLYTRAKRAKFKAYIRDCVSAARKLRAYFILTVGRTESNAFLKLVQLKFRGVFDFTYDQILPP